MIAKGLLAGGVAATDTPSRPLDWPTLQSQIQHHLPTTFHYWLDLLHTRKGLFGYQSEVDDPNFFLSPTGKSDPVGELHRELELFQTPDRERYICRFPLRFLYLQKRFHLPPFQLSRCPELRKVVEEVAPTRVSIIFADATINKPAYMFGHTLLRLENPSTPALISTAINYAAETNPADGGLAFAFKGLFGFYPGYFTPMPFYDKIKQYLQNESRDLWEYPLRLNRVEATIVLLHSWELKDIYTDYYFFTENCSYELLWLLQVAHPDWEVIDRFRGRSVIPLDTIRYLYRVGGIGGRHYRPSLFTQLNGIVAPLTPRERWWVRQLGLGEGNWTRFSQLPLSPKKRAQILDGAIKYLLFTAKREGWSKKRYLPIFLQLTTARSKIPVTSHYHFPPPPPPEEGHHSHRFRVGVGKDPVRGRFWEVGVRGAYHSFRDLPRGFKFGNKVVFLEPRLRYYPTSRRWQLEQLKVVELKSILPRTLLFRPISWKVEFGLYRRETAPDQWRLIPEVSPGGGFGYRVAGGYLYGLVETSLQYSSTFPSNLRVGIGGEVGYLRPVGRGALYCRGEQLHYLSPPRQRVRQVEGSWVVPLSRNDGVELNLRWYSSFSRGVGGGVYYLHYFSW